MFGSRNSQKAEDKEQNREEERLGKENVGIIPLLYKMTLPDGAQVKFERSHLDLCTIFTDPDAELTPLPGLYEDEDEEGRLGLMEAHRLPAAHTALYMPARSLRAVNSNNLSEQITEG